MGLLHLLLNDPATFTLLSIPLLYSIIIHELAHGWVAYKLGDPTAMRLGRLSLNPLKHLEPVGTLMLFVFGFGWAKPVPVNFSQLRQGRMGFFLVSAAGIVANALLAFAAFFLNRVLSPSPSGVLAPLLFYMAQVNIMLAPFNLIPIPPLDGSKILMALTSGALRRFLVSLERYGFFIIIGLLYLGALDPLIVFFRWALLTLIRLLLP